MVWCSTGRSFGLVLSMKVIFIPTLASDPELQDRKSERASSGRVWTHRVIPEEPDAEPVLLHRERNPLARASPEEASWVRSRVLQVEAASARAPCGCCVLPLKA